MFWLLLQSGPAGDVLLERGLLGTVAFALLTATLWFFRRMVKENDELRSQRDTMVVTLRDVVPLLDRSATIIERSTAIHEQRQAADERDRAAMQGMKDALLSVQTELRGIRVALGMRPNAAGD